MSTKMRMKLTIDVECPEEDIDAAFPVVRERLLAAGLGPWKWEVEDFDARAGFQRQRPWSPRPSPSPATAEAPLTNEQIQAALDEGARDRRLAQSFAPAPRQDDEGEAAQASVTRRCTECGHPSDAHDSDFRSCRGDDGMGCDCPTWATEPAGRSPSDGKGEACFRCGDTGEVKMRTWMGDGLKWVEQTVRCEVCGAGRSPPSGRTT